VSFARLRKYIEQELENVVIKKEKRAKGDKTVISYNNFNAILNPV